MSGDFSKTANNILMLNNMPRGVTDMNVNFLKR